MIEMLAATYDPSCTRCPLALTCQTVCVGGTGGPDRAAMIVGEAPGADEDETGVPFVGAAGELLTEALLEAGADRGEVWITNVVKCRPPGNRNPEKSEIEACGPYFNREVNIIKPRVMLLLGNIALKAVLGYSGIMSFRGAWRAYLTEWDAALLILPTYHPAFCKRQPQRTPDLKRDVKSFIEASRCSFHHSPAETWSQQMSAPFPISSQVQWRQQTDHGTAAQPNGAS